MPAEKDAEHDSRWIHRPTYPADRYEEKKDEDSDVCRLFRGMRHLIDIRKKTEELCEFYSGLRTFYKSCLTRKITVLK